MGYSDLPGVDPAAGAAPATITTDANNAQKLLAIQFQLDTSATVTNRSIVLTYSTAAGVHLYDLDVPFYQTASKAWTYSGAIGGYQSTQISINDRVLMQLPDISLPPGSTVEFNATMHSGDQFHAIGYLLQDVSKNNPG